MSDQDPAEDGENAKPTNAEDEGQNQDEQQVEADEKPQEGGENQAADEGDENALQNKEEDD